MEYSPRTTPRAHQTEALRRIGNRPRAPSSEDVFALLMDMGTGKSKVIVDEFGGRVARGDLTDLLIIAPAGSYRNWDLDRGPGEPSELTKHMDPALRAELRTAAWRSGMGVEARRELTNFLRTPGPPRVFVVNVEALSSVEAAREACGAFLRSGRVMAVVDESTRIKNPRAKRTKQVVKFGQMAAARRILSGLVAPRCPLDVYSQFEFLDWRILGFRNFYSFRSRYAITKKIEMAGRTVEIDVGYRNVEELQERVGRYSFRVLKEDCLDLDPKTYATRDVALTTEQLQAYREVKKFATTQLAAGAYVTATAVITQILRLHQIVCGFVTDEDGVEHDLPERRTDALMELLEEHQGKAIIWVPYDRPLRKIAALLTQEYGPEAVACYWGGNRATRQDDEARFKQDPRCRYMVSTPGAGGIGNTWVVADLAVYYANNYDLEHRSQSEDRNHRDGQTRPVTYVDLVVRGSVDEKIHAALREKINLSTAITGENYREWLI